MKNIITCMIAALGMLNISSTYAAFWIEKIIDPLKTTGEPLDWAFQTLIAAFFMFLYIIAVIVVIYAGFTILTAAGDEEKIKRAKTMIIQAIVGLIIIFLAASIVEWLTQSLLV